MKHKLRLPVIGIALGVLLVMAAAGLGAGNHVTQAAVSTWTVNITGDEETPPIANGVGKAIGTFSFDDATRVLSYDVNVQGLSGDQVTASHIHKGAVGVAGPVIYPLSAAGVLHIQGTQTLTAADVTDLNAGNLYFNVHSVQYPGGFARAQLIVGGTNAAEGVRKTADAAITTWNAKNVEAFLALWTDAGLKASFDATRDELRFALPQFIGTPPISLRSLSILSSTSATALARVELAFGLAIQSSNDSFVFQGGSWKFNNETEIATAIPSGTKAVDLRLQEFSFTYDKNAVSDGNFAFRINNAGKQDHEVVLVKVAPGTNLQRALASADPNGPPPPGIDDVAQAGPFDPGQTSTMVFTQSLSNGHYALLCFLPDTDGLPHALKGMISEFDVTGSSATAPAGATVRPPNTGDAGLLGSSQRELSAGLLALGILTVVAGFAGLVAATKRA